MKFIQTFENPDMPVMHLVPDPGEHHISKWYFYHLSFRKDCVLAGELFIPEGIEDIGDMAFNHLGVDFKIFHFPKSLTHIGENMISGYSRVKIFYAGSSEAFLNLAKIREEQEYVSDGYDHYPYYSGNSGWVSKYYCFDGIADTVEVYCEEDGVTLLYGTRHRTDGNPPKVKQE